MIDAGLIERARDADILVVARQRTALKRVTRFPFAGKLKKESRRRRVTSRRAVCACRAREGCGI